MNAAFPLVCELGVDGGEEGRDQTCDGNLADLGGVSEEGEERIGGGGVDGLLKLLLPGPPELPSVDVHR